MKNDKVELDIPPTPVQRAAAKLRSENHIQYKPEHLAIFAEERKELGVKDDASIEEYCHTCVDKPNYRMQTCNNWGCPNCAPHIEFTGGKPGQMLGLDGKWHDPETAPPNISGGAGQVLYGSQKGIGWVSADIKHVDPVTVERENVKAALDTIAGLHQDMKWLESQKERVEKRLTAMTEHASVLEQTIYILLKEKYHGGHS